MKILQINSVCGRGSTGRIVTDIADTLRKNGHESYVAYGYGDSNEPNSYRMESNLYLKYNILKTRLFGKHGFYNKGATKGLVDWITQVDPDAIHLHNIHGHYLNIDMLFCFLKSRQKPVIWTLHDCWSFTGHCAHFDYVGCERWKTECKQCPQQRKYPDSWLLDRSQESYRDKQGLFTSLDKMILVTPSKWLANQVKQSFLKDYPTITINNGIDLNTFKPTGANIRDKYGLKDKFIVLGVANYWDETKGLHSFSYLSRILDDKYQIMLVGISQRQRRKLPSNIICVQKTSDLETLAGIYSTADVFVNPTLEDNFPTTNLEAIACGTPVITFDTGGCKEIIDDYTGTVIPQGDMKTLIESIKKICTSGKNQFYSKCIQKAQKKFNRTNRYHDYLNLYCGASND